MGMKRLKFLLMVSFFYSHALIHFLLSCTAYCFYSSAMHSNKWNVFKSNIKSLFPKIDELRYMANYSNAAVIGFSESKLDESVLQSEIQINNYDLLVETETVEVLLAISEVI